MQTDLTQLLNAGITGVVLLWCKFRGSGQLKPIDIKTFGKSVAYLGVQVDKDSEMKPRQVLSSVPFAMIAEQANTASRLNCVGCVTSAHLAADAKTSVSRGVYSHGKS